MSVSGAAVFRGLDAVRGTVPTAVAVGTFDGVHLGHQALIAACVQTARAEGLRAIAVTFDPHPMEVIAPLRAPTLLTATAQREVLLARLGLDAVVVLPFDAHLRAMEPERFVKEVLLDALHASVVHVGEGFTFGRSAAGTPAVIEKVGCPHGLRVRVQPLADHAGAPISSSRIRNELLAGNVEEAAAMLGRYHSVRGIVVEGEGIGRKLGFATANLRLRQRLTVPGDGVYATQVTGSSLERAGACSIGTRPTFGGRQRVVEVHLLDFDGDLYGAELEVHFVRRLRDQLRYDGVEALVEQMRADVAETRAAVDRV